MIYVFKHKETGETYFYHDKHDQDSHWRLVAEYTRLKDARRDYPKAIDHRPLGVQPNED